MRKYCILVLALVLCLAACGREPESKIQSGIYFHDDSGRPLTGWQDIDGSRYYLGSDGQAAVGIFQVDGKTYCFDETGAMRTGWAELDGRRYYLRSNGTMVTGWFSCEGQRYYLSKEGAAVGVREVEGKPYVFDGTGKLTTGWAEFPSGRAYGDPNGHPLTGWQTIDGVKVHFEESGVLSAGWTRIDGFAHYFYIDGTPAQGEIYIDGQRHRFASNGQEIILVNPWNYVPEGYSVELTDIEDGHQIASIALEDYHAMMKACRDAGMEPMVCSSYRTQEYQEALYQRRIDRYMDDGYSKERATELAGRSVAIPGTSEHQLGLAIDIVDNDNWDLNESQADMPTQKWLMANSWRYGWILRYPNEKSAVTGIIYEPWHYRYVGREIAKEVYESGLCLEEYLMMLTPSVG